MQTQKYHFFNLIIIFYFCILYKTTHLLAAQSIINAADRVLLPVYTRNGGSSALQLWDTEPRAVCPFVYCTFCKLFRHFYVI